MKSKYLFSGLLLCLGDIIAMLCYLPPHLAWLTHLAAALAIVLLLLLWHSVLKPAQTVVKGMELIKAQDFNNRLRPVHEGESDKIVDLFNQMIDKLRNERLYNREQDGFLKLLIEASPMGVVMMNLDGKVEMINESFLRITGIGSPAEAVGKDVAGLPSILAAKMAGVALGENKIIRHGSMRMYRCYHLSFIRMGFPCHFYLLESLTEEVMKAERAAYEKVIRIISHEVNNTMGGVRSVLETLHDIIAEEELREVIDSCDDRCNQMCNFISSYADVVRIPEPLLVETDINEEVRKIVPFLHEMAGEDIAVSFTPSEETLKVSVDVALMQQVIVNIVKNATESISGKGSIKITTEAASSGNGNVLLTIANDGDPISEDVSRNLFSPFFTTKRDGRGLGLTLIGEILNRHKARYSLLTDPDGITRFRIRF